MSYQEVKYKLINNDLGTTSGTEKDPFLKTDPKNWDDSEKTLKRSTKTYGVYTELSKNLEFSEDGADFLRIAKEARDIEADVVLEEWRNHPNLDGFYLHSTGYFDFSTFSSDENYVKVAFKTGGLNPIIESQLSQSFELDREDSLTGVELSPLSTIIAELKSRKILLISSLNTDNFDGTPYVSETYNLNDLPNAPIIPPLTLIAQSDSRINSVIPINEEQVSFSTANPSDCFYNFNDVTKVLKIKVDYDFEYVGSAGSATLFEPQIYLWRYNGIGYNYDAPFYKIINDAEDSFEQKRFVGDVEYEIELQPEDSLVISVQIIPTNVGTMSNYYYNYKFNKFEVSITEDSIRAESNTKAVFMHEVGDRLMKILTGEDNKFYSEFYGREDIGYNETSEYALTALALGFWVRKFDDKKIEVSLKDFLESSNAIHNTGYTISDVDGTEKLVLEDMKYFFNDFTGIRLTEQVSDVERKVASDFYSSKMEFGYKRPDGENLYEEAMGLDEYNTKTTYSNPITRVDNKYDKISIFRADSYGREFARRKPKLNYPEEDTRYDKDSFILDLKEGLGDAYVERIWSDDYESLPTGVYSPETATGLRITPFRNLERHQWFFGSGLFKFPEDYVRYTSNLVNSELTTKKTGEDARSENSDIKIKNMEKPLFKNEWIEFSYPVDFYVNEQVYGSTDVNGRKIPNFFGKVEFINEFNQKEYGYLFELKPNKEGKWKLLKAM
jgi:hypothetical protein